MSDDTILSRLAELERENAELRKTNKADIDRRAEQLGMRCDTCWNVEIDVGKYWCDGRRVLGTDYCRCWRRHEP